MAWRKWGEKTDLQAHYAHLLRECKSLIQGRELHAAIIKDRNLNTYLSNLLVQMYGDCGSVQDAFSVFYKMGSENRNSFSWTIMFTAFAHNGQMQEAKQMFDSMPGRNVVSWNSMIACYARCESLLEARNLFDRVPERTLPTWNAMVTAYAQNGHSMEALKLFRTMDFEGIRPDRVTFISACNACGGDFSESKLTHTKVVECGLEPDTSVGNSLITMYGKCCHLEGCRLCFDAITEPNVVSWTALLTANAHNGVLQQASYLFEQMPVRNEVAWTAIIAANAQLGNPSQALVLFKRMDLEGFLPDKFTLASTIDACTNVGDSDTGMAIHSDIVTFQIEHDAAVGNSLVSMYGRFNMVETACTVFETMQPRNVVSWTAILVVLAQNGHLQEARSLFDRMPLRNVVSWNAMLTAHVGESDHKKAIELYKRMCTDGILPDRVSFISVLEACACSTDSETGISIHGDIREMNLHTDPCVGSALINMYARCGRLHSVSEVFNMIHSQDVVLWSGLISAYSQNGYGAAALQSFHLMQLDGVLPNDVTFVSVITACNSVGLVSKGWHYLAVMRGDYGIEPGIDHLVCMVNLLGRSGRLAEAEALIEKCEASHLPSIAWKSLLSSCYGDVGRATRVSERVFREDPGDPSSHITLSNIYAATHTISSC